MIIKTTDLYDYLITLPSLAPICDVFSVKPIDDTKLDSYLYMTKISDNPRDRNMQGLETKLARIQFTIICKKTLLATETTEQILNNILEVLENEFEKRCQILSLNGIEVIETYGDILSPILWDRGRAMINKDFYFLYKN